MESIQIQKLFTFLSYVILQVRETILNNDIKFYAKSFLIIRICRLHIFSHLDSGLQDVITLIFAQTNKYGITLLLCHL